MGALPTLTLALLLLLLTSSLRGVRTYVVEAVTTGAEITFTGTTQAWYLGNVVMCVPLQTPDLGKPAGSAPCDHRRFAQEENDALLLEWRGGSTVKVRQDGKGDFTLILGTAVNTVPPRTLPPGTVINIDKGSWRRLGALTFAGTVAIGGQITSGESSVLLAGSYEARERSYLSGTTETIKSGTLRRGERATIVNPDGPAPGFGHITAAAPGEDGFHIVNIAQPGNTSLQVEYLGGAEPTLIRPNWIDHAIRSPLLVALVLLLSLCAGVGQLLIASLEYVGARPGGRNTANQKPNGSE